jgi:hypothetical protein
VVAGVSSYAKSGTAFSDHPDTSKVEPPSHLSLRMTQGRVTPSFGFNLISSIVEHVATDAGAAFDASCYTA